MAFASTNSLPLALEMDYRLTPARLRNGQSVEMELTGVTGNGASTYPSAPVARRLQAVTNHVASTTFKPNALKKMKSDLLLVLPDGGKVAILTTISRHVEQNTTQTIAEINLDGSPILTYTSSPTQTFVFDVPSVGTRYEGATSHIPRYNLISLGVPTTNMGHVLSIENMWVSTYALFTAHHEQEHIPIVLSGFPSPANAEEIKQYLLTSGLAQRKPQDTQNVLFLSRAMFWQGSGTCGFHSRSSWLLAPKPIFPSVPSFTRNERVIARHPLRPTKPQPGEVLYRRWCTTLDQMLEISYFDLEGVQDRSHASGGGLSRHMAAFHRWHNDERINTAWGERGSLETHREYVEGVLGDPHVLPCMFSWDGELSGYLEIVYVKENHVAQHYPVGVAPGDWERGIHVLNGESKFLGGGRSEIWIRSLLHYIFLADPRTDRVVGEPSENNKAIVKVAINSGFHIETVFDFPYKRSVMVLNPRAKFFTLCRLR
ncbi:acyl-CoA N-acyltransferase [Crassisporium funariophilum]|nr:acyl-CoA N-acyltransferase [Crassisporium funariophilum]